MCVCLEYKSKKGKLKPLGSDSGLSQHLMGHRASARVRQMLSSHPFAALCGEKFISFLSSHHLLIYRRLGVYEASWRDEIVNAGGYGTREKLITTFFGGLVGLGEREDGLMAWLHKSRRDLSRGSSSCHDLLDRKLRYNHHQPPRSYHSLSNSCVSKL